MTNTPDDAPPTAASERSRLLGRPIFWVLLIGVLWSLPLIKSLTTEMPEMLPGIDEDPLEFEVVDDTGREITAEDLRGHLLVIAEMTLANADAMNETFDDLRNLRKRMRGLGHAALFVVFCHGGQPSDLTALLDERKARKPANVFVLDPDRSVFEDVRVQARSRSASFIITDSHGRVRGVYGPEEEDRNRMLGALGQLANWRASDPPLPES